MLPLLAMLVLAVSAADHWTTYLCLRHPVSGWEVTEANPLADWLFQSVGLVEGLAVDSLITIVAIAFLVATPLLPRPLKAALLIVVIASTSAAVANNLDAIFLLGISPLPAI